MTICRDLQQSVSAAGVRSDAGKVGEGAPEGNNLLAALLLLTYCFAGYWMVEKNTYEELAVFQ
jgi:hypothetical protein